MGLWKNTVPFPRYLNNLKLAWDKSVTIKIKRTTNVKLLDELESTRRENREMQEAVDKPKPKVGTYIARDDIWGKWVMVRDE